MIIKLLLVDANFRDYLSAHGCKTGRRRRHQSGNVVYTYTYTPSLSPAIQSSFRARDALWNFNFFLPFKATTSLYLYISVRAINMERGYAGRALIIDLIYSSLLFLRRWLFIILYTWFWIYFNWYIYTQLIIINGVWFYLNVSVDLLQMLEFNNTVSFPAASLLTVILALVGEFINLL